MAIKRKDIRDIMANDDLDFDVKAKKLLDLVHEEIDNVRDEKDQLQAQLEQVKADLTAATSAKEKAESDFNNFKNEVTAKSERSTKETAYTQLLKNAGIGDKHIRLILKATDIDSMKLDKDGKFVNAEELTKSIKADYADYVAVESTNGATVDAPPSGRGTPAKMTKAEIMAIKDTSARQKAIAENHEIFGI